MANRRRNKKKNNNNREVKDSNDFVFAGEIRRLILGVLLFLLSLIILFSFFESSGVAGKALTQAFRFLVGRATFIIPLSFFISAIICFWPKYSRFSFPLIFANLFLILGIAGVFGGLNYRADLPSLIETREGGGLVGYFFSSFLIGLFGFWIGEIVIMALVFIGGLIFWQLLNKKSQKRENLEENKPSLIKKIFSPKFEVKEVSPSVSFQKQEKIETLALSPEFKTKPIEKQIKTLWDYQPVPLDLLEADKGGPTSGDTRGNSVIIKKTLQNFDIPVEMSEINIGPTVAQYTLKPAEGVKLSKITGLSNDLALALAAHPIRIEAPIPGRSLVGVEVPNKVRAQVRLRNLIANNAFQNSSSDLTLALGRDVSGHPFYSDLARMPHLLVAGATGTGKTIFMNSLLLSLLYKNSPSTLRLIMVDPKRVEFPVYNDLPHLLCPVIYNANFTHNALRWLTGEMDRRFEVLAQVNARDIMSYNNIIAKKFNSSKDQNNKNIMEEESVSSEPMPYIVLVVDELADLMAAKGREIEAGIVRLAQMARAVGIHLVVATQRPSVEVITGLIKANITSRVTFQVASQVDSRTVLDTAGAEKLLGSGDLLYLSAEITKPRRIQGPYISEKEIRGVVNYIKSKTEGQKSKLAKEITLENHLAEDLGRALQESSIHEREGNFFTDSDPLFEDAKIIVVEAKKASASLLQRRLRIGYARAARLLDLLENKGIVGPGEGAKPREVYFKTDEGNDGWEKV
ncbi:MAG: DNA translocase FtsK [Patescibacteria group bacterium]